MAFSLKVIFPFNNQINEFYPKSNEIVVSIYINVALNNAKN